MAKGKPKDGFGEALASLGDLDLSAAKPKIGGSKIALALIDRDPMQPRKRISQKSVEELAHSIEEEGQLQPVVLRPNPDSAGRYLLVIGERRMRAFAYLKRESIEAIVREPKRLRVTQLVENLQRENLSVMETAHGLKQAATDHKLNNKELAAAVSKPESWVSAYMSIFKMPEEFVAALEDGRVVEVYALNELFRLYKKHQAEVLEALVNASVEAPIDQVAVRALSSTLKGTQQPERAARAPSPSATPSPAPSPAPAPSTSAAPSPAPSPAPAPSTSAAPSPAPSPAPAPSTSAAPSSTASEQKVDDSTKVTRRSGVEWFGRMVVADMDGNELGSIEPSVTTDASSPESDSVYIRNSDGSLFSVPLDDVQILRIEWEMDVSQ